MIHHTPPLLLDMALLCQITEHLVQAMGSQVRDMVLLVQAMGLRPVLAEEHLEEIKTKRKSRRKTIAIVIRHQTASTEPRAITGDCSIYLVASFLGGKKRTRTKRRSQTMDMVHLVIRIALGLQATMLQVTILPAINLPTMLPRTSRRAKLFTKLNTLRV